MLWAFITHGEHELGMSWVGGHLSSCADARAVPPVIELSACPKCLTAAAGDDCNRETKIAPAQAERCHDVAHELRKFR